MQTIPRPELRLGDLWRFAVHNRLAGVRSEETRRVVALGRDRIECDLVSTDPGFAAGRFVYTRHWNLLSRPAQAHAGDTAEDAGRWVWRPHYPQFRFPLRPGKRWQGVARVSNAATDTTNVHRYTTRVLEPQPVDTPAGRFDTLPVRYEADVTTEGQTAGLAWRSVDLLFYAPKMALFARAEFTVTGPDGAPARDALHELIEFRRDTHART
jgi:hypothetical protein